MTAGARLAMLAAMAAGLWYVWRRPGPVVTNPVSAGVESVGDVVASSVQSVQSLPSTASAVTPVAVSQPPKVAAVATSQPPARVLWPHQEWRAYSGCSSSPGWGIWDKDSKHWACP